MSEIVYVLTALVDDTEVFSSSYEDTTELQEDLVKAELAVEKQLEEDGLCMLCGEEVTANCNNANCS